MSGVVEQLVCAPEPRPVGPWSPDPPAVGDEFGGRLDVEHTGGSITTVLVPPQPLPPGDNAWDHEGNLWIATNASGLHRLKPALFTVYGEPEGLSYRNVYSVYEDRTGTINVGTWGGGLSRISADGSVTAYPSYPHWYITALLEDAAGRLLVGSLGGGVTICTVRDLVCGLDGPPILAGARVHALHQDRRGDIWIGHENGLARFDATGRSMLEFSSPAPQTTVRVFQETRDGALWMGTNGGGVLRFAGGRFDAITEEQGLPGNLIRSLYEDEEGWLWIGTEGRGLARLDPRAWGTFFSSEAAAAGPPAIGRVSQSDGLFDEVIHQIVDDGQGRFWMSTNRGIFRVFRSQLIDFLDGRLDRIESIGYTEREGLRNREANGGFQPVGILASDGRVWFATQDGVAVVDPGRLSNAARPPPVVIEAVMAGEATFPPDAPFALEPDQRDIQIEYTALTYAAPEYVRFRYRLDGYNDEWVEASGRRTAFYTGVPPGSYTFRVAASAESGAWSEPVATAQFTVTPRFYETNTYYALLALALGLAALGLLQYRERRARTREAHLARLVEDRTSQIRSHREQLERQNALLEDQALRLEELDRAKSRFFANLSHEFRTPLTLTIGPLEDLRDGMRGPVSREVATDLDLALRNSRRLLRLVNQILDVSRLEAGQVTPRIREENLGDLLRSIASSFAPVAERRRITFSIRIPAGDVGAYFDADLMEKVFTNLL